MKIVRELSFTSTEAKLEQEILEALGERTRLARASATAVLLGLLALLFAGHAIAVALGAVTPIWAGRLILGSALALVGGVIALIAYGLANPAAKPIPQADFKDYEPTLARRIG